MAPGTSQPKKGSSPDFFLSLKTVDRHAAGVTRSIPKSSVRYCCLAFQPPTLPMRRTEIFNNHSPFPIHHCSSNGRKQIKRGFINQCLGKLQGQGQVTCKTLSRMGTAVLGWPGLLQMVENEKWKGRGGITAPGDTPLPTTPGFYYPLLLPADPAHHL